MKLLIVRTFPDILEPEAYNIQEIGLAKALTRKGISCGIVLYYGKNKSVVEEIKVDCGEEVRKIQVYRLRSYNLLKNGFFPELAKIIKQYDVIQVHEYDQISSWMCYGWLKKPVVVYHGPYYDSFNKGYNLKCKVFDHTFLKIKSGKKIPCLTKSRAAAEFLRGKGFENVMPVGVGLDMENLTLAPVIMVDFILKAKKPYQLLYIGKLEERRNCFFLLEVFRGLLQKEDCFELTIIGNGEAIYKENFLERAGDLIKEKKLHYIEKISQKEIGNYYQKADLMVFPSRYEIFGMVLLEAMYYNLPIASSDNGGADMLIRDGENGLIIDSFDCKIWVERICDLFSYPQNYNRILNNLQNEDKTALTWDGIADRMMDEYSKCREENIG